MENLVIDWEKLANVIDAGSSVDEILASEPDKDNKDVIKAVREYSGTFNTHFSRQIMSNERDINGENRGIAPNFIHSLDACHMRMVIRRLSLNEITDVWSVHDAFGCHPNHIELLRNIVNKTFGMVHELNDQQRGILTQLYHNNLGKDLPVGTMNIDDVAKSEDGELVSKYLIS
jgi:DNA-directed RNA polymerase